MHNDSPCTVDNIKAYFFEMLVDYTMSHLQLFPLQFNNLYSMWLQPFTDANTEAFFLKQ